jgi:hypothetical protein
VDGLPHSQSNCRVGFSEVRWHGSFVNVSV